jgi:hypothetical protein
MQVNSISKRFRVLTLNLWQPYGSWADRRCVLSQGIQEAKPDLVAFAESVKTSDYDQAADLLGPGFTIAHSKTRDPNEMGISIASRWSLGQIYELDLSVTARTAGFPCTTLAAEINAPDSISPLLFVHHFPSWQLNLEYERELQAVAAARFVEERVSQNLRQVVMAGDLDEDPEGAGIRFFTGRQSLHGLSVCYRDAWESTHPGDPGHTFTPPCEIGTRREGQDCTRRTMKRSSRILEMYGWPIIIITLVVSQLAYSQEASANQVRRSSGLDGIISEFHAAYAAFNRGDFDAAVAPLDPKIEWSEPVEFPGGGTYQGREAVKR